MKYGLKVITGSTFRHALAVWGVVIGLSASWAEEVRIAGSPADRAWFEDGESGNGAGERIGSIPTHGGGRNASLIFALPRLRAGQTIKQAELVVQVIEITKDAPFNVDVYGIGFFEAGADPSAFYEGPFRMDENGHVGLINDWIPLGRGMGPCSSKSVQRDRITRWVQSFYNTHPGYSGGMSVVFRLSPDQDTGMEDTGCSIASANHSNPAFHPVLTLSLSGEPESGARDRFPEYTVFTPADRAWIPADADAALEERFRDPPDSARPWVFWEWMNGHISREGITKDLEMMQAVGIGGAFIINIGAGGSRFFKETGTPQGPVEFGSDEWFELISFALAEANRLGLETGTMGGAGWSSAGGPWVTPELAMKKLVWAEVQLNADSTSPIRLPQPETEEGFYRDIAVLAFPTPADELGGGNGFRIDKWPHKSLTAYAGHPYRIFRDTRPVPGGSLLDPRQVLVLTDRFSKENLLNWNPPPGNWTVLRFGYTVSSKNKVRSPAWGGQGLETDKLSRKANEVHWNSTIGRIRSMAGKDAEALTSLFVDSFEAGYQNWCEGFDQEFESRCGYDLIPWLVGLTGRVVGGLDRTERFLWDFRRTAADLMAGNYYGFFVEKCARSEMKHSVEPYGKGHMDSLQIAALSDIPMGEFWVDRPHAWHGWSVKLAASAAHLYGKRVVGAEAFTSGGNKGGWSRHPYALKKLGDYFFTEGMNRIYFHNFTLDPWSDRIQPGMTFGPYGINLGRKNTWLPRAGEWFRFLSRTQFLLQEGHFVADFLYVYPEDAPNTLEWRELMDPNPPYGYDYDAGGYEVLQQLTVKDGRIVLPNGMSYCALVLPISRYQDRFENRGGEDPFPKTPVNPPRWRLETLREMERLVDAGATVVGDKPLVSPSLEAYPDCDSEVSAIAGRLWGSGRVLLNNRFPELLANVRPDFAASDPNDLRWIHRSIDSGDFYYVCNQREETRTVECVFRIDGRQPELWNPITGETRLAPNWRVLDNGCTEVSLTLGPVDSVFVVFREPTDSAGEKLPGPVVVKQMKLEGPWSVEFGPGGPQAPTVFRSLAPWNRNADEEIRYFSGTAVYHTEFTGDSPEVGEQRILDLGDVGDMAAVKLNGRDLGLLWKPPFRVDLSDAIVPGKNILEIEITNRWMNRLIGDEQYPDWGERETGFERFVPGARMLKEYPGWLTGQGERPDTGRKTFATCVTWTPDTPLPVSGLAGPVRIEFIKKSTQ